MENTIHINREEINSVCKQHSVINLYLFGSYAKNTATENSDIDFLVRFGDVDLYNYFDNYLSLKDELEKLYNRKVDLVEEQTVKNPFLAQSINQTKILIYG